MQRVYKKCASIIHRVSLSLPWKYNLTKDTFTAWYYSIISKVDERISHTMVKYRFQQTKIIIQNKEGPECLKMICLKSLM